MPLGKVGQARRPRFLLNKGRHRARPVGMPSGQAKQATCRHATRPITLIFESAFALVNQGGCLSTSRSELLAVSACQR